jgi:hypothetical protein
MPLERHEIPTHLNVEDRAFYGLSVRQVMYLTGGFSLGYGLWNQWGDVLPELRLALSIACALAAVTLALVRPGGRGFEEWGVVVLRFLLIPRRAAWRLPEPGSDASGDTVRWLDLEPRPRWKEDAPCEP